MWQAIDMTGWNMCEHGVPDSRLTVIKRVENTKDGKAQWLCKCRCGTEIVVRAVCLKNGDTKSCGCLKKEVQFDIFHKINKYDIIGDIVVGQYVNTENKFYFDVEFYECFSKYCWYENSYGYTTAWDYENQKEIKMHQLVCGRGSDHIDRNKSNNTKLNLRLANQSDNRKNSSIRSDNSSGIIGVHFDETYNKYVARIQINRNNRLTLYYGDSKYEAIKARLEAEKKYFGDFAPQIHLFEQYGINNDTQVILDAYTQQND